MEDDQSPAGQPLALDNVEGWRAFAKTIEVIAASAIAKHDLGLHTGATPTASPTKLDWPNFVTTVEVLAASAIAKEEIAGGSSARGSNGMYLTVVDPMRPTRTWSSRYAGALVVTLALSGSGIWLSSQLGSWPSSHSARSTFDGSKSESTTTRPLITATPSTVARPGSAGTAEQQQIAAAEHRRLERAVEELRLEKERQQQSIALAEEARKRAEDEARRTEEERRKEQRVATLATPSTGTQPTAQQHAILEESRRQAEAERRQGEERPQALEPTKFADVQKQPEPPGVQSTEVERTPSVESQRGRGRGTDASGARSTVRSAGGGYPPSNVPRGQVPDNGATAQRFSGAGAPRSALGAGSITSRNVPIYAAVSAQPNRRGRIAPPQNVRARFHAQVAPAAHFHGRFRPFVQRHWESPFFFVAVPFIGYVTVPDYAYERFHTFVSAPEPDYDGAIRYLSQVAVAEEGTEVVRVAQPASVVVKHKVSIAPEPVYDQRFAAFVNRQWNKPFVAISIPRIGNVTCPTEIADQVQALVNQNPPKAADALALLEEAAASDTVVEEGAVSNTAVDSVQ